MDALSDMLGVEVSVGSVSNPEGELSDALAPATAEALASVRDEVRSEVGQGTRFILTLPLPRGGAR